MSTSTLIRRLFALPPRARRPLPLIPAAVLRSALPGPGEIALYTGASGGGKSRLLSAVRAFRHDRDIVWIDPTDIALPEHVCVIERTCAEIQRDHNPDTGDSPPVERALELLSRVGLAEAWTYLQTPAALSDGQRWRLILALAIARAERCASERGSTVTAMIAMDEFAALLDRITARIVSRALRRLIDRGLESEGGPCIGAIVVTSHDDLLTALSPDILVTCDFLAPSSVRLPRPAKCPGISPRQ